MDIFYLEVDLMFMFSGHEERRLGMRLDKIVRSYVGENTLHEAY